MTNDKQRDKLVELIEEWYKNAPTKYLADYILANGAIVPPCKVGDVVWLIGNMKLYTKEEICSRKIISVQMLRTGELIMHFKDGCFSSEAVGVYVFHTREEAEAKLKEGVQG